MKKLLLLTLAILTSLTLIGRPRGLNPREIDNAITDWVLESLREMGYTVLPEVIVQDTLNRSKKSNYEKYWEEKHGSLDSPKHEPRPEYDDLYYLPSQDQKRMKHKKDTVKIDSIIKDPITINNYYYDDNFYYRDRLRPFFYPSFYFSWNFYTPYYYRWYDPFYYDWYFPYSWYTPYYSWNYWWGYPNHYVHYDYHYGYNNHYSYNTIQYGRRDRPSTMTQNNSVNRRIPQEPERRTITSSQQRVVPQNKPPYEQNRRTYAPTYERPRMSTRPNFNNSRTTDNRRMDNMPNSRVGTQTMTERKSQDMLNNIENRRSVTTTPSRSYNPPSSRSYSEPMRNNSYSGETRRDFGSSTQSNTHNFGGNSGSSNSSNSSNISGGNSGRRR